MFSNGMIRDQMTSAGGVPSLFSSSVQNNNSNISSHMSATALLQKAAQLGSTSSTNSSASLLRNFSSSSSSATKQDRPVVAAANLGSIFGEPDDNNLHDLMNSFATGNSSTFSPQENPFGGGYIAANRTVLAQEKQHNHGARSFGNSTVDEAAKLHRNLSGSTGGSDRLTRDFLGVGQIMRSMSGGFSSQRENQSQNHQQPPQQQHQHAVDMGGGGSSLDSERNSTGALPPTGQSFGGNGKFS